MKKFIAFILISAFIITTNHADTLYCIKDQIFEGIITKSTNTHIKIKSKNTTNVVPKNAITKIIFSRADFILHKNDSLKCKIINKHDGDIYFINEKAIKSLPENEINLMIYNAGDTLNIDKLPTTGDFFVNLPLDNFNSYKFKRKYYFQFSPGYHTCKSQYRVPVRSQKVNSVEGFKYAGEVGFSFTDTISAGIGIEAFLPENYLYRANFDNNISYMFYYLSSKISYRPLNISVISYFTGIDLGLLSSSEELTLPTGQTLKASASGLAARIKIGSSIQFKSFEASLSFSYLFSNKYKFNHNNPEFEETFFIFDGLSVNLGINILFFVNKNRLKSK